MSTTPIFDSIFAKGFSALPTEYTDRYTPEVARQAGYRSGAVDSLTLVLGYLESFKRTKAIDDLIRKIENLKENFNE